MKIKYLFAIIICIMLLGCSNANNTFTYCNPNKILLMRDTHIIPNYDDGKFYAIGTLTWGGKDSLGQAGFRLYESDNLKDWNQGAWIMEQSTLPKESWYKSLFWAPEIHKINGKWYFTYNCSQEKKYDTNLYCDNHASGISVADNINGPYTSLSNKPIVEWPTNDLTLFQDEDDKVYAFFNNGFFNMEKHPQSKHSIFVAEVDLESGELKEKPHKLLTQEDGFESIGIEGAHVVKVDGYYYLFYSGFYKGYAVGYAVSTNIYGPYKRASNSPLFGAQVDGGLVRNGKVDYDIEHPYREIGHNQIFKGPDGRYWTSCHAYIKGGDNQFGSYMIMDPLNFKDGIITTDAPTWKKNSVKIDLSNMKAFPNLADKR